MLEENMKELIKEKFKDDPLWEQITILKLEDALFPKKLLSSLNPTTTYSISQAAEILEVKEQAIRNNLNRNNFDDYIQTERLNHLRRLDYEGIFKFHMAFILMNYANRSPADVASYAGTLVETGPVIRRYDNFRKESAGEGRRLMTQTADIALETRLEKIEQTLFFLNWERSVQQAKNELESSLNLFEKWEKECLLIGQEIENLELKRQVKKLQKLTPELVKESHRKVERENSKVKSSGLLGIFLKNKPHKLNYSSIVDEAAATVESIIVSDSNLVSIDEQIKDLRSKRKELEVKKEDLIIDKQEKEKKYLKLQEEFNNFKEKVNQKEFDAQKNNGVFNTITNQNTIE